MIVHAKKNENFWSCTQEASTSCKSTSPVLQRNVTLSSSSSSEDDDLPNIGNNDDLPEEAIQLTREEIIVHETKWRLGEHSKIDNFSDIKYKPKLYGVTNIHYMNELDIWLTFFPHEEIDNTLDACNENVDPATKRIGKSEYYRLSVFCMLWVPISFTLDANSGLQTMKIKCFPVPHLESVSAWDTTDLNSFWII